MQSSDNQDLDLTIQSGNTLNRLRMWFDQTVDLAPELREAWMAANVADAEDRAAIRRLLSSDGDPGYLDTPAAEHASRLAGVEIPAATLIGQRVGTFRLVRALGQGGMAAVFLGERVDADFHQEVAIKLLRRGLYSELEQRLFQRERRILAALDHPNIARLIDGGVTDAGIPYLVMEFIDGSPITLFASDNALDLHARLRLFLDVCRAVEAAHQNLIVHRDIKPSNILVTRSGEVRLLDFGIAKLIVENDDSATDTAGAFTPGYAAPEQVHGGAITTATDVYGLGVLLHEMLLGHRPDSDGREAREARRPSSQVNTLPENEGAAPRMLPAEQLRRSLRGDLDNILLKALEKEPGRRYASAGRLADDIDRHLAGRPVVAHPPTRWYRTRKFVQRHRGGVTVTAILALAVFAALALALWQSHVAREQTLVALGQTRRAEAVKDLLIGIFDAQIPARPREQMPDTAQLLEQGAQRARTELSATPEVQAEMLTALGHVYNKLALQAKSEPLLDQAIAAARKAEPADPALLAAAISERGQVDLSRNRYAAALALFDQAVTLWRQVEPNGLSLAGTLNQRALAYSEAGNHEAALADYQAALKIREKLLPADDLDILDNYEKIGSAYDRAGRFEESDGYFRKALDAARAKLGEAHVTTTRYMKNYGANLGARDKYDEAIAITRKAVDIERTLYPKGDPDVVNGLNNLGYLHYLVGHLHEAQAVLEDGRALNVESGRGNTRGQIILLMNLGSVLEALGENGQALILLREAEHIANDVLGADHDLALRVSLYRARSEFNANPGANSAGDLLKQARRVTARAGTLGQANAFIQIEALVSIGRAKAALGEDAEAQTALHAAVAAIPQGRLIPRSLPAVIALADWEASHGARADAESLLREFIPRVHREMSATHYVRGQFDLALAELLARDGRSAQAREAFAGTEAAFSELPESHPLRQRAAALKHALDNR